MIGKRKIGSFVFLSILLSPFCPPTVFPIPNPPIYQSTDLPTYHLPNAPPQPTSHRHRSSPCPAPAADLQGSACFRSCAARQDPRPHRTIETHLAMSEVARITITQETDSTPRDVEALQRGLPAT